VIFSVCLILDLHKNYLVVDVENQRSVFIDKEVHSIDSSSDHHLPQTILVHRSVIFGVCLILDPHKNYLVVDIENQRSVVVDKEVHSLI
jgi:hypothetical protein